MKYEIAYLSVSGNTEKLAHGIADRFPHEDTFVTDLSCESITKKADIYIIGFGVDKGTIPLRIIEALEEIEGKPYMFFITGCMEPTEAYKENVEQKLLPFLPDDGDYRGIFMCRGKISDEARSALNKKLYEAPENPSLAEILRQAKLSENHPDSVDVENAYAFVRERI